MSLSNIIPAANALSNLFELTTEIRCGKRPCPHDCELQEIFHNALTIVEKALLQQKSETNVSRKNSQRAGGKRISDSLARAQNRNIERVDELQKIQEWTRSTIATFTQWKKNKRHVASPTSVLVGLQEFYTQGPPEFPEFALPFKDDVHYPLSGDVYPPLSTPLSSLGHGYPQQSPFTLGPSFSSAQPMDLSQTFESYLPHSPSVPLREQTFDALAPLPNWPVLAPLPSSPSSSAILARQLSSPTASDLAARLKACTQTYNSNRLISSPDRNASLTARAALQPSSQNEVTHKHSPLTASFSEQNTSSAHKSLGPKTPNETFTFSAHQPICDQSSKKKRGSRDRAISFGEFVAPPVRDGAAKVQKKMTFPSSLGLSTDVQARLPDTEYLGLDRDFTWPMSYEKRT